MTSSDKILEAAVALYSEKGFRGATTRAIAEAAGVNEVTLFRHFKSKAGLIEAAMRYHHAKVHQGGLPEDPVNPLEEVSAWCVQMMKNLRMSRELIRRTMCEMRQYPKVHTAMKADFMSAPDALFNYIERLREKGMAETDFDTQAAVHMLRGALFSDAMGRDLAPMRFPEPESEAPTLYARLFLRAIGIPIEAVPGTAAPKSARTTKPRAK